MERVSNEFSETASIRAINVNTGTERTVASEPGSLTGLAASPGGSYLYFSLAAGSSAYPLHRISVTGANDTIIAPWVSSYLAYTGKPYTTFDDVVLFSNAGRRVAFLRDSSDVLAPGDSLLVLDETTGERLALAGQFPLALSPDGTALLTFNGARMTDTMLVLALNGSTTGRIAGQYYGELGALTWRSDGPTQLVKAGHAFSIANLLTGQTTLLFDDPAESGWDLSALPSSWSRDGSRVAVQVLDYDSPKTARIVDRIYVADANRGRAIASVFVSFDSLLGPGRQLGLSPDGSTLALLGDDMSLQVATLP